MQNSRRLLRTVFSFSILSLGIVLCNTQFALSASLIDVVHEASSLKAGEAATNHTLSFATATTAEIQQITFRYSTEEDGTTKPDGLILGGATLGTTENIGGGWTLQLGNAASGILTLIRSEPEEIAASTEASIALENITNSSLDACEPGSNQLTDTCFVKITTYSDAGITEVDSGSTTYTVFEEAYLNFEVKGVDEGETHSDITTTHSSTATSLPFGRILSGEAHYLAQQLDIATNAPNGYKVYVYVDHNLRGSDHANTIHPFGATNVTWDNPAPWQQPDGTEPNDHTGWFGANTTDTRVGGSWTDGAFLFGPISNSPHLVALSEGRDPGSSVFVTYALAINSAQPSDTYSTNLVYDIQPTY